MRNAVRTYLEAQCEAFEHKVTAIQRGYDDVKAGRTVSLELFEQHMLLKYGIPALSFPRKPR